MSNIVSISDIRLCLKIRVVKADKLRAILRIVIRHSGYIDATRHALNPSPVSNKDIAAGPASERTNTVGDSKFYISTALKFDNDSETLND